MHIIMERTERLLTPAEVAHIFGVDPKTVTRWAAAGLIWINPNTRWAPQIPRIGSDRLPARPDRIEL